MSVRKALYTHLTGDTDVTDEVSTRIYPNVAPTSATLPYAVFNIIGSEHDQHLGAATGLVRRTVQLDVFASDSVEMEDATEAIRGSMDGYGGVLGDDSLLTRIHLTGESDDYIPPTDGSEVGVHHARMEWSIWHTESVPTF